MLGKLVKYEFRSGWKIIGLMNLCTVLVTGLGCIELHNFGNIKYDNLTFLQGITLMTVIFIYVFTMLAVNMGCVIYIAVRYYKNLYTDEGYLMHTLPVTPRKLLLSKLLVHTIYSLFTSVLTVASVAALLFVLARTLGGVSILREFQYAWRELEAEFFISRLNYMILMLITFITGTMQGILQIYVSAALGQLASKHKVLASIGVYIAVNTALSVVGMIVSFALGAARISRVVFVSPISTSVAGVSIAVISAVVFYVITEWLMAKKLNLD